MASLTSRLKLRKPATTDTVNVDTDLSANFDAIDLAANFQVCTSGTRPSAPYTGLSIFETDTSKILVYNGTSWVVITQSVLLDTIQNKTFDTTNVFNGTVNPPVSTSFKNGFINGSFDIWQRGTSVTLTGGQTGYTCDRWVGVSGTGATNVFTRTALTLGAIVDQAKYRVDWNRSVVGTTDSTWSQRIEGVQRFAGQQVTVSAYLTASAGSIDFQFRSRQNFGTTGSPSADVGPTAQGGTQTATTTRTRFSATFTVPSISGKTLGTDNNDFLEIQLFRAFNATNGTTGTLQIEDMQIEAGPVATSVERIPVADTLLRCQRYYIRWTGDAGGAVYVANGLAPSTTAAVVLISLSTPLRALPALSTSANTDILFASATNVGQASSAAPTVYGSPAIAGPGAGIALIRITGTVASGLASGNATLMSIAAGATKFFALDAEL